VEAMMEEAVMEAAAECDVREARRECRVRGKGPAGEPRTCETRADATKAWSSAHSTEMHPAAHAMHPAAHAMHSPTAHAAMAAKATTASTSRER